MDEINVRRGETLNLGVVSDDTSATVATLYIGNLGQAPVLTKQVTLTNGEGSFELTPSDTNIAIGTYKYQINISHADGEVEIYPNPDDCGDDGLPEFKVADSLSGVVS